MGDNVAPRFTQKPSLKQEGASIVFHCEIEASPQPSVTWYRGDTVLADSGRINTGVTPVIGTNKYSLSLVVQNVNPQDSGTYKVEARNQFGQMSANINLNLQGAKTPGGGAPSFLQKPAIKQLEGGKKIVFECRIAADPKPVLHWFREDIQLNDGGRYRFVEKEESAGQYYVALELSNPQPVDGANYRLNAKNQAGESNANLRLNFDVPGATGTAPKFLAKPVIRQVGSGVVFEVRLTADPSPSITWYKGSTVISQGGRYNVVTQTDGANFTLMLEISNITPDDGGSYKVTAKNKHGESNANLNLNLEGAKKQDGKAPKFLEKPSIQQQGGRIILLVLVEAKPEPTATWYHDNMLISSGGRINIHKQPGNIADSFKLICEISQPSGDDGGQYKCTAQNEFGTSNANLALNLSQPPKPKAKVVKPSVQGEPMVQQIVKEKRIIIQFVVASAEKPTAVWAFGGQPILSGGRYSMDVRKQGDNYLVCLEIHPTSPEHSGSYQCTMKNEGGEIVKMVQVAVEEEKKPKKKKVPTATLR